MWRGVQGWSSAGVHKTHTHTHTPPRTLWMLQNCFHGWAKQQKISRLKRQVS